MLNISVVQIKIYAFTFSHPVLLVVVVLFLKLPATTSLFDQFHKTFVASRIICYMNI